MGRPIRTPLAFKSYQHQAEGLVRNYLLSDPFIPYSSVIGGILACKMVYDMTHIISTHFKSYNNLTKIQKTEWNNRGISTVHAIFISAMSLYFVFWSHLFSDVNSAGLITFRNSPLSTLTLGASFCWLFHLRPWDDLLAISFFRRHIEYIVHHSLSGIAVAYSMITGEGQLYRFLVLISEVTTPEINMRWYLDTAGLKKSAAYLINGIVIFLVWLVARILLFVYMFYHVYLHHSQVMQMHIIGFILVYSVPTVLAIMNLMWFGKILKGLKKTLAIKQ